MIQKIIILLTIQLLYFSNIYFGNYYDSLRNNLNSNEINDSFSLLNININNVYYKLFNYSFIFSFKFNIIQVEYNIMFFNENNSIITPSDLTLIYDVHLICSIYYIETNISIDSLGFINENEYFKCLEYVNINEKINFGILIYKPIIKESFLNFTHYFFSEDNFNYIKHLHQNNKIFHPSFNNKQYNLKNNNKSINLKKLYNKKPEYNTKFKIIGNNSLWKFYNIYNHYFCSCKGHNCLYHHILNYKNSTQICKYNFYLNLIEENKYLYNKTDYLLADFPGDFQSMDDAYPIFKKLINLGKNAYYMTINKNLFHKKRINNDLYKYIIKSNYINGDFLEKYFELILRLKAVISGAEYLSFKNIFFHIDYITFISLTHGLNYFKTYLFKTYYGRNTYHKLVISTSKKIISLAVQSGWKEKDLIKICLPKWDKLGIKKNKCKNKNISIFFFLLGDFGIKILQIK